MKKIKSIYSLKELHDLLEKHTNLQRLILFLDLDLTLIKDNGNDEDELIEPDVTKKLFEFLHQNKIWYTFVTARFHDIVPFERKRNESLEEIKENIEMLYPIFEELGISCDEFKKCDDIKIIKNDKKKTVGIMYKGILLGDKKGEIIKYFRLEYELDKSHPHVIFVDDIDRYLKNVVKHVPEAVVFRREISD